MCSLSPLQSSGGADAGPEEGMDAEQAARWAAAQEVAVGADLVPAALRQLEFLAAVDRRRWLYEEGPLLDRAIHRYKACWLPLLAKHTEAAVVDGPLVVPLDCEWIWHCHRLNPVQYIRDCKKIYGRMLNNDNVESSTQTKAKIQSENIWTELYPEEPFELVYTTSFDAVVDANPGAVEGISYDLVSAVKRQSSFYYQVGTPTMHDPRFLEEALARYKGFLYLIKMNQEKGMQLFRVPTYDVDLMWHTHQLHPVTYCNDMLKLLGKVLEHDDMDADRSEGKKLDVGFTGTTEQFESTFGVRYWKTGAMYRGNMPSPVTSTPQIFSSEVGSGFGSYQAEKHLTVLETNVVELYLQIVDIKNLPTAIPKESVHIQFTKNRPDNFISHGGRLDIATVTGKNTGAGLLCETTGELVLTVMVDRASKKSEPIGKVSIPLQELIGPDSKLSFERWFELKLHGGHASLPPVSLRVAASSTVPTRFQQVLTITRVEPFSLMSCLLPHSIKDQKMSNWARLTYDCGTELIRLQIREDKAKNGMAFQELVGVSKSTKKQFVLAEFKENKWRLKDTSLSITQDIKPSNDADGCILELKGDNKLIKLYRGRKLEYQQNRCNCHSEDAQAVTAVKFCAEHPYGKAVALLDTESQLIMVNEDWFLLPWIAISFLFLQEADGKGGAKLMGGAMVQKVSESDTTMGSEEVAVGDACDVTAHAQCGTACGGDKVVASDQTGLASPGARRAVVATGGDGHAKSGGCGGGCSGNCGTMINASTKVEQVKAGGCGGGCSGNCGTMVSASTKVEQVKAGGCGGGCSGNCGTMVDASTKVEQAKSGGCGGGCSGSCGTMVDVSTTKVEHANSGGCGSGCGGGCGGGGGCGTMFKANTVAGQAKSGGCGGMVVEGSKMNQANSGGCGGGCGGMVVEGSKTNQAKSGGCGSGCGGGCGGGGGCGTIFKASAVAGQAKSGGCGSGCGGGGCGGMAMEGSMATHAKSGGCGSGCGGGCGTLFNSSTAAGQAMPKSDGCGGGGCGGMVMEGSVASRAGSGGCGSGCGGGGCGGGAIIFNASATGGGGQEGQARSGGCGSGCGGGCGGGAMFNV